MKTIDAVVNYWDARLCNIRHSPKPVGTKEYFDEVEKRKYVVEPHIPKFVGFPRWSRLCFEVKRSFPLIIHETF